MKPENENRSEAFAKVAEAKTDVKNIENKNGKGEKRAKKQKKPKTTSIGGQAVIEGVMMRGRNGMAVSVRDEDGVIRTETKRLTPPEKKPFIVKLPIIRGMVSYFDSLFGGMKTLMRSAEVFGETEEPSKFEKWVSEKLHIDVGNVVLFIGVILGVALSLLLFVVVPQLAATGISLLTGLSKTGVWYNLIEGGVRMLVFVGYILLTSLSKSVKRVYMYHGAEHKTINCYESGKELTVENARACTRVHDRCGTTFMFFVMLISIIVFSLVNGLLQLTGILRMLVKIALMFTLVSGLSYELLKGLAKTKCFIFYPLKAPGLLLQHITTREPDDAMLEVAITAFNAALAMDENPALPEQKFATATTVDKLLASVDQTLKCGADYDVADGEWIVSLCTGVPRSAVKTDKSVAKPAMVERATDYAKRRAEGEPLWYIVGDCDFYGYKIKVDGRVLIPRPETEELCEFACEYITKNDKVLDMCTGSGAIAITVAKKTGAFVEACDISEGALSIARENADLNGADVKFFASDVFKGVTEKYSVIISNPPYIKRGDIDGLSVSVKNYEPKLALDGGEDGLDFYRIIARDGKKNLFDGGLLFLEVGINQADDVAEILKGEGFTEITVKNDLEGVARMIKASYNG